MEIEEEGGDVDLVSKIYDEEQSRTEERTEDQEEQYLLVR